MGERVEKVREVAGRVGVEAVLVPPGSDMRYLIGETGTSFERLTCLVIPVEGAAVLVVPKLEAPGYGDLDVEVATWVDGDDPYALVAGIVGRPSRVAVGDTMTALHVLALRHALPDAEQSLAGPVMRELRMRKDATEIESLRAAGAAIDRVHARMAEWLRIGRTEAEVGADIAAAIVEEGHVRADFVIVGSGPNGASPHHDVSGRGIEPGDVVVVDIGGPLADGYNSDSTRTYAVGEPREPDVTEAYAVLQAAQQAAVNAVRPGITAEEVDAAARTIIAEAGFGDYFIHRTGHGIGLDVHEDPYIVTGNNMPLEPGMTFSVEPGIYFPDRWGARIEDIVAVTSNGVESLNTRPHDLTILPA